MSPSGRARPSGPPFRQDAEAAQRPLVQPPARRGPEVVLLGEGCLGRREGEPVGLVRREGSMTGGSGGREGCVRGGRREVRDLGGGGDVVRSSGVRDERKGVGEEGFVGVERGRERAGVVGVGWGKGGSEERGRTKEKTGKESREGREGRGKRLREVGERGSRVKGSQRRGGRDGGEGKGTGSRKLTDLRSPTELSDLSAGPRGRPSYSPRTHVDVSPRRRSESGTATPRPRRGFSRGARGPPAAPLPSSLSLPPQRKRPHDKDVKPLL